ncbi:MAG: hypothetical protein R2746_09885 [Acidimicrobiales bacterium]
MSDRPEPGVATAPPPPTVVEPPPPAPHPDRGRWIRRGLIAALLLGAVAVLVLGGRGADTDGVTTDRPGHRAPVPHARCHRLRQTEIGVDCGPATTAGS